jgi:hypothetical protein
MADNIDASVSTNDTGRRFNPGNDKNKKWDKPKEARKSSKAGDYPNYFSWKTRSGNSIQIDDSQGGESVTIQHRGGSSIQMLPDGSIHFNSMNGKYEIVYGEDRMTISGLQDITVKGDATMRVYGDYNVTCHKDYNLSVLGNMNVTSKNLNRHVLGNMDTQARNENKRLMGSSAKIARGGIAYVAKGSITHASQSDQVHIGGAAGVNLAVKKGNITQNIEEQGDFYSSTKDGSMHHTVDGQDGAIRMRSKQGKMEFKSKEDMNHTTEQGNYKVTAQQGDIGQEASQGNVQVSAQSGGIKNQSKNFSVNATQSADITTQQSLDLRATGQASLSGSTTYVTGQTTTNLSAGTAVNVDGPSALNLNGGMSQSMSALGIQIPFNFGSFTDPDSEKGKSRGVHAPDAPASNDEVEKWNQT